MVTFFLSLFIIILLSNIDQNISMNMKASPLSVFLLVVLSFIAGCLSLCRLDEFGEVVDSQDKLNPVDDKLNIEPSKRMSQWESDSETDSLFVFQKGLVQNARLGLLRSNDLNDKAEINKQSPSKRQSDKRSLAEIDFDTQILFATLLFIIMIWFLCCCCSPMDLLACFCCWEICCDDGTADYGLC